MGDSNNKRKIATGAAGAILFVLLVVLVYGISWLLTCAVIKLITICFGLTFKLSIATGIWLVLCVLKSVFQNNSK